MLLQEMAKEYRRNITLLELRVRQLQAARRRAHQPEVRYRLKRRINCLQGLINESRKNVYIMEHYYDRGGDKHENRAVV